MKRPQRMKSMAVYCVGLAVASVLALGPGCDSDDGDASLVNAWARHVEDAAGQGFDAAIVFGADGSLTFEPISDAPGHTSSHLKYRLEGEQIVFYDDAECGTEARYSYVISGSDLTLTAVEDPCGPRVLILQATWTQRFARRRL